MIRPLKLALAAAFMLAGPAQAQKFVSVDGQNTRMTVGAIAAAATPAEEPAEEVAADAAAEGAETPAEEVYVDLEPSVIDEGDYVDNFVPEAGECGPGSLWNQEAGTCQSL